jgi:cytochrome c biogenesis protein CcmG, thiol:disulfide interchange protein DsbE
MEWDRRRTVAAIGGGAVVAGVIALLVVGFVNRDVGTSIQDALEEGERPEAPAFTAPVLLAGDGIGPKGADVSLDDLRGRTVVLNFWASWCEPCQREMPALVEFAKERPGVQVVGLAVTDVPSASRAFAREVGADFPLGIDRRGDTIATFGATGLPATVFIDREGRVAGTAFGELTRQQFDGYADKLES